MRCIDDVCIDFADKTKDLAEFYPGPHFPMFDKMNA